MFGLFP